MIKCASISCFVFFSLLLLPNWAFPEQPKNEARSLREKFIREYPIAIRKLKSHYANIRGSGTETIARGSEANWVTSSSSKIEFAINNDQIKISRSYSLSNKKNSDRQKIESLSKSYAFRAEASRQSEPLSLTAFQPKGGLLAKSLDGFRRTYLTALYDETIWDPAFKASIGDVFPVVRDGRNLIKIEYTTKIFLEKKPKKLITWILVAPDDGWVLIEKGSVGEKPSDNLKRLIDIEYGPSVEGVPTIKKISTESRTALNTIELDNFTFGRTTEEEFTLDSVGLPEVNPSESSRWRFFWLFNLIFAGLLLLIAVVGVRRVKKQSPPERPPLVS